jgi:hypothetical protein
MRVAVVAWGSLVWNRNGLATVEEFGPIGPRLPIEFSRVSGDGRLTLVIDESAGATCATYAAPSTSNDLDRALEGLWIREGRNGEKVPRDIRKSGRVAFLDRISGQMSAKALERHPRAVETIDAWAAVSGYDAAIWTTLEGNFRDRIGELFSVEGRDPLPSSAGCAYARQSTDLHSPHT